MNRRSAIRMGAAGAGCSCLALLVALSTIGMDLAMGVAVYLDSERTVVSRHVSADGRWVAQLERLVVGGAPSMVVTLRKAWDPDWYLSVCKAASHYGESAARLRWTGARTLLLERAYPAETWGPHPPLLFGAAAGRCGDVVILYR